MALLAHAYQYKVHCSECPLRDCEIFRPLNADQIALIADFKQGEIQVECGDTILSEDVPTDHLFTLLQGWSFRYKTLEDGRRQITNFLLPGDFIGLQATQAADSDHSVEALTPGIFCIFPRSRLLEFFGRSPSLAFDVTWLAAREERVLDEHLLSLGRRTATERTAYYLVHLFVRASDVGLASDGKVRFPFTQQHLSDALGLSLVHTNKVLRRLALQGLIKWEHGWFEAPRLNELAGLADYDLKAPRPRPLV